MSHNIADEEVEFWDKNDVPYQSLIKILLSEKVNDEFKKVS